MIYHWSRGQWHRPVDKRPMGERDALLVVDDRPVRYRRAGLEVVEGDRHTWAASMVITPPTKRLTALTTGGRHIAGQVATTRVCRRRSGRVCIVLDGLVEADDPLRGHG